jgi:hypothetical protein
MNQPIFRDGLGRVVGTMDEWFTDENESYFDYKVKGFDVRFPEYKGDRNGEVKTYHISELKNK